MGPASRLNNLGWRFRVQAREGAPGFVLFCDYDATDGSYGKTVPGTFDALDPLAIEEFLEFVYWDEMKRRDAVRKYLKLEPALTDPAPLTNKK